MENFLQSKFDTLASTRSRTVFIRLNTQNTHTHVHTHANIYNGTFASGLNCWVWWSQNAFDLIEYIPHLYVALPLSLDISCNFQPISMIVRIQFVVIETLSDGFFINLRNCQSQINIFPLTPRTLHFCSMFNKFAVHLMCVCVCDVVVVGGSVAHRLHRLVSYRPMYNVQSSSFSLCSATFSMPKTINFTRLISFYLPNWCLIKRETKQFKILMKSILYNSHFHFKLYV